ncbi:flavin reductase family protein [Kitasatospora griseola]|uniref:flavin reductase family protein n=1 Tax=Kitasatospora griseola TaxID=2064 RepID=UPI0006970B5E|nr:flavin reductase family protein [Kitasatospora griseola]
MPETAFRSAARHWPTGVAVLTVRWAGLEHAKTVSSFATLSLDPLLIGVAVSRRSPLTAAVRAAGRFTVAVLGEHQAALARRFATPGAGRAQGGFTDLPVLDAPTAGPVPAGATAWFDARLHAELPVGDHLLLIGETLAVGEGTGRPLLHHAARYRQLGPELPPTELPPTEPPPTGLPPTELSPIDPPAQGVGA